MKILFVWPNKDSFGFKPIGLSLLSAIARDLGWETKLFDTTKIDFGFTDNIMAGENAKIFKPVDLTNYGHKKSKIDLTNLFKEVLNEFNPDCLAVSVLSDEVFIADLISKVAKKENPHMPIIWGGKYPSINPERTLIKHNIDFVCVGEGLDAFKDFLNYLSGKRPNCNIPNIWAKKGKDEVIVNNIRQLRKTLDDLPYVDWSIFDSSQFYKPYDGMVYKSGDHMLNWGCPYHCSYCINHLYHIMYHKSYFMRRYSVRRIIDELIFLKNQYSLELFKFHDEDFLMRPLRNMAELSEAYKSEVNIPFVIETNPNSVTAEKVRLLKEMNCVSASLGVETGDQYLRKIVLKRVDSEEDIIRAFKLLNEADIRTSAFIMLGIPFETRETYGKTIELMKKANVQYPCMGFFFPFEGTELRKLSIQEGLFDPVAKPDAVFNRDEPALIFKDLSKDELIEMRNVFNLYIKLPDDYNKYIGRSEKLDKIGIALRKKLILIYDETVFSNNGWYHDTGITQRYIAELEDIVREG